LGENKDELDAVSTLENQGREDIHKQVEYKSEFEKHTREKLWDEKGRDSYTLGRNVLEGFKWG
jgi:hypothetical protein